jgi:hypothetical protein
MTSVFLSYSRADNDQVTAVVQILHKIGIEIWRDQESLYGGQFWPKAIGEALAEHDFFLLVWSRSASLSHFVEFEWTTAVALCKPVIPCLLDDTPLPFALKAIQGINVKEPDVSARLTAALHAKVTMPTHWDHVSRVLSTLKDIKTIAPDEVVLKAKAVYTQQGWNIQGNVYQAKGDIHVTIQHPSNSKQEKSKLEIWSKRVALVAAALGIVISLFTIPDMIKKYFPVSPTTPLRGIVLDSTQQPLANATIEIEQLPGQTQATTSDGGFVFDKVPGNPGDRVRVFIKKTEYKEWNEYVALPGPVRITLEEKK